MTDDQEKLKLLANDISGLVINLKAKVASGQDFAPELNALANAAASLDAIASGTSAPSQPSPPSVPPASTITSVSGVITPAV